MKQKLTLLLLALFTTMGAWATDVTVIDKTKDATTYGSLSDGTFTTNAASGMAGVTVSGVNFAAKVNDSYGYCLGCTNVSDGTVTMTAPEGYVILGYSLTGRLNTSNFVFTLTPSAGGNAVALTTGGQTLSASGLEAQTASFTYAVTTNNTQGSTNTFYMPSLTITIGTAEEAAFAKSQVEAYNTVQGWVSTIQSAKGLVTDAANYISNAKSSAEGSYEALLDGNYATYFHGAYGSQAVPNEDQYLQATLPNAVDAIYFYFKKRSQNNANRPTSITISGSNDGSSFTDITTINSGLPTDASVLDYTSSKISLGASYQYIRFTVTATNNGATHSNGHVFFTFSEFYILPSDNTIDAVMGLRASLVSTPAANYTTQNISDVTSANAALLSTMVNVTYNLYDVDGTTLLDSKTVEQEKNSAVSIPSSFITKTWLYDYSASGTIGESDCTITVNRTYKSGVVTSLDGLSNSKAYRLVTERGTFTTYNGALANTCKTSYTLYNFAIVNYEDAYYLWSIQDDKFVAGNGTALTETPTAITFNALTEPLFKLQCGSNYLNASSGLTTGAAFDSWSSTDGGNSVAIIEAADFNPDPVIAALTSFAPLVVANIKPFFDAAGSDLFQLKASVAEANNATYTAALTSCSAATYDALLAIVSNADNFNLPEAGKFYLVKNNYNGKYMHVTASGKRGTVFADLTAEDAAKDASAHFTFVENNSHLYMSTQGEYLNWVYNHDDNTGFTSTNFDKYVHFAAPAPGVGAFSIAFGNGVDNYASYLNSGFYSLWNEDTKVVGGSSNGAANAKAQWTFEEVSTLSITLNGPVEDSYYYATFCVPFNVTLDGATAYTLSLNADQSGLTLSEGTTMVAAGTPVLLKGTSASATATISTAESSAISTETALTGTYFAKSVTGGTDYFLGNVDGKVGFYHWDGSTLSANRAYLEASKLNNSGVKGFALDFEDDATGINNVNANLNLDEAIYNLAGQRLSKMQKGINIINGKKILK